ncbi:MAG: ABC transporter ATP-binding protein [Burkholderiales bacterium]|nr:ABC transporter ATP-binding protein [Burkholderiales bacterium]
MPPILEAADVVKHFGGLVAVDCVSFAVEAGERVAIIGPNGAGKSTLFNVLNGRLHADAGRVVLEGVDVTGMRAFGVVRRGVGRTMQITSVFGRLTVFENVHMAVLARTRRTRKLLRPASAFGLEETDALLERIGLADRAGQVCGTLSHGDQKRVEVAMMLALRPRLLMLDEPAAGSPATERQRLAELILGLVRAEGLTLLVVEHDLNLVFTVAARILVLHQGRLIADGTPDAVRENVEVQRIYLGEPAPGRGGVRA